MKSRVIKTKMMAKTKTKTKMMAKMIVLMWNSNLRRERGENAQEHKTCCSKITMH